MMQLFRAAERAETRWKNGGGITRPVASAPGQGREFGWRLSLADISAPGPFSLFPGISRLMGILEGRLRLEVQRLPVVVLSPSDAAFAYPGEAPTFGAPLGGMVRGINLMFDPACFAATLDYAAPRLHRPAGPATHIILALAPLKLNGILLGTCDAALLAAGEEIHAEGGPLWIAGLTPPVT
nr:HutD family protein [uncultured Acidocella sp.]